MPADLWILPLVEGPDKTWRPGTPRPFVNTPEFEGLGAFSPDGKLLAYMSSVQGAFQIFVKPFEGEGGPWRVSTSGGAHPVWSKSANELLFTIDDQIMVVRAPLRRQGLQPRRTAAMVNCPLRDRRPNASYATSIPMASALSSRAPTRPAPRPMTRSHRLQFLRRAAAPAAARTVRSMSPQQFACRDRSAHWQQRCR